jgi:hypothetical protein
MLRSMRFQVEVRPQYEDLLRRLAFENHRAVREHAVYLLELKLAELAAMEGSSDPSQPVAEVA